MNESQFVKTSVLDVWYLLWICKRPSLITQFIIRGHINVKCKAQVVSDFLLRSMYLTAPANGGPPRVAILDE